MPVSKKNHSNELRRATLAVGDGVLKSYSKLLAENKLPIRKSNTQNLNPSIQAK